MADPRVVVEELLDDVVELLLVVAVDSVVVVDGSVVVVDGSVVVVDEEAVVVVVEGVVVLVVGGWVVDELPGVVDVVELLLVVVELRWVMFGDWRGRDVDVPPVTAPALVDLLAVEPLAPDDDDEGPADMAANVSGATSVTLPSPNRSALLVPNGMGMAAWLDGWMLGSRSSDPSIAPPRLNGFAT